MASFTPLPKYVHTDMAESKVPVCSLARDVLSLGCQARSCGADSYVHVGIIERCARRNRVGLAICPHFAEDFGGRIGATFEDGCGSLLSSFCLPVVTMRRGELER
jgi:hypothetical protein